MSKRVIGKTTPEELVQIRQEAQKRFLERQERIKQLARENNQMDLQTLHTEYVEIPEEVLLEIFAFLDVKSLCLSCTLVCRSWNLIQKDNSIWAPLYQKKFKNLNMVIDENDREAWRNHYISRSEMRNNWYNKKCAVVYMDMSAERYESNKKSFGWTGKWTMPKEDKKQTTFRVPSPINVVRLAGENILTGDQALGINIWNGKTHQLTGILKGHTSQITDLRFSNGKVFSCGFGDKRVLIWDVNYGICTKKIRTSPNDGANLIKFHVDDRKLYGITGGSVEVLDIETDKHLFQLTNPHGQGVQMRDVALQENVFCTSGYGDGMLQFYDCRIKVCIKKIKANATKTNLLYVAAPKFDSQNKNRVSFISSDYNQAAYVSTYDFGTGKELRSIALQGHAGSQSEGFDDEKVVRLVGSQIQINNRDNGKLECTIAEYDAITCIDYDEGRLVCGNGYGEIIYMYYGGSNFYWSGMKGGKVLGTKEDKIIED